MAWVCSVCSSNNLDSSTVCEICGEPKPAAAAAPKTTSVCTLTQTRAKEKCAYADVTVPEEYNVIGENAFKGRTDLYTVRIHSGVTKIMRGAFEGCTNLYGVYVDGGLSSIGARAFAGCKYLSPEKRPTADTVAKDAFDGCSPTPIGTPSRNVGARPATKKPASSTGARPSTGTRSSGTTRPITGSSAFTSEFSKTSSTGTKTASTSTGSSTSRTPTPPPRPSYTPPPPPRKTPAPPRTDSFASVFSRLPLCILIALSAFIGVFLFTDWGVLATPESWQTAMGLATVFCVGMLTHQLYSKAEYRAVASTISVVSGVCLLNWLFNGVDTVLCTVISVGAASLCFIFSYLAFDDSKTGCGWWMLLVGFADIAHLIILLVRFNYFVNGELWQVLVGTVLVIFACVLLHNFVDLSDYTYVISLSVVGFIVTGCMLWWFGCGAAALASVCSLGLILVNVVGAVVAFDDYETGVGVGCIIFGVLQLMLFVLTHLIYA